MNLNEMWRFISDNADAIGVIITITGLIGGVIGFLIKVIIEHITKKKSSNSKVITDQQHTIEEQKNQILTLTAELDKYRLVQKATDGEVLIQKETNTRICPICWSDSQKPIPVFDGGDGYYTCSKCNHKGIHSYTAVDATNRRTQQFWNEVNSINQQHNDHFNNNGWF